MTEEMAPGLTSVVIPVYNGARFLKEAIESVLSQQDAPLEIIVVDDGSDDASAEVAERYGPPVRCLRQAHSGVSGARNAGIAAARGEFLAFVDADDLWAPARLLSQVDLLSSRTDLDCVFGLVEHFWDGEASSRFESRAGPRAAGLLPGAMLIRRKSFLRVGLFDVDRQVGEFIDWQIRAQERGLRFETLPVAVLRRRIHDANMSARPARELIDYVRVIRAALDRRRSAGQP